MIDERLTDLTRLLDASGARYEILIHDETIASAADGLAHGVASLSELAPTLILETEKGPIAAIISGETRLSYKKVKKHLGLKNVSLATREAVKDRTGADVGSVSLINPGMPTIVDTGVAQVEAIYGGCGIPCHTLRIHPQDLIKITGATVFDCSDPKTNR
jgi:prolyl-tRNA editing enzyme YbaK/EbsC (Cys-tRNA(Pro) deacylase)